MTAPLLTGKVAVEAPATTFTDAGAVSCDGSVSAIVTVTPPATAALFSVTVQVPEAFESREVMPHCSEVTVLEETREMLADALVLLRLAVRVAV